MLPRDVPDVSAAVRALTADPGDPGLRRKLCEAVYESVWAFLLSSVRMALPRCPPGELEELLYAALYQTFRKAIRRCEKRNTPPPEGDNAALGAYFRKAAKNALKDQINRLSAERSTRPIPLLQDPPDESAPEEPSVPKEVEAALASLGNLDRQIVDLHTRGLSYKEICQRLDPRMSPGACRLRYSRAIRRVREALKGPQSLE